MDDRLGPALVPAAEHEALLEFLYLTPVGIIRFRPDGAVLMANPAAVRLLLPLSDKRDMSNLYVTLAGLAPGLRDRVDAFLPAAGLICEQLQLADRGRGNVLTLTIHKIGRDTLMAVIEDITAAIEQEIRIRADQVRLSAITDTIRGHAVFTARADGTADAWNESLRRTGGWEEADIAGVPVTAFFRPAESWEESVAGLLDRARDLGSVEFEGWCLRKDGSAFWSHTVTVALPAQSGQIASLVLIARDMTESKQKTDELTTLAATDPLTGAANRRSGEVALTNAFSAWCKRAATFTVLMMDCDHFKAVNDRWGHDAGDTVLLALVRRCREEIREADLLIRWGGEEFLLLLRGVPIEVGLAVAERLRQAMAETIVARNRDIIMVTVSIGVAAPDASDTSVDDIVRRADRGLYGAKRAGRNRVLAGLV